MPHEPGRPTAYLKQSCPFCLKFRIFLVEAGLDDRVELVEFADGDETHRRMRAEVEQAGVTPTFPALKTAEGEYATGTDELIARFAEPAGIDPQALPLLRYYEEGVFRRYREMFMELREARSRGAQ